MAWTISKSHRVLRLLNTQLARYKSIVKLYPQEHEQWTTTSVTRNISNYETYIDHCRNTLESQTFEKYLGAVSSFEQFLQQFSSNITWTLAVRAAFEVGSCIELTQDQYSENDWHESLSGFGNRYGQYTCLGRGISIIVQFAEHLKHVMPAFVIYSLDNGHFVIAQKLFSALVTSLDQDELLVYRELMIHLATKLHMQDSIVQKIADMKNQYEQLPEIVTILNSLEEVGAASLEPVLLSIFATLRKCTSSWYACKLLEIYFERAHEPTAKSVAKLLRKLPVSSPFITLRKVVQLYVNFKYGNKWLNLTGEDDIKDISRKFVALYKFNPGLFRNLVEFVYPASTTLAVEASKRFVNKHFVDMKTVLWQDDLTSRAMQELADKDDIYDATMGVWMKLSPNTSVKRRRNYSPGGAGMEEVEDQEVDELSLIKPPNPTSKRRKSSGRFKPKMHYDDHYQQKQQGYPVDDICLIAA